MSGTPTTGGSGGEGSLIPEMYLDYMKQVLSPHLVAEKCFDRFFVNFDFFEEECFKYTLSKGLGMGIILGSLMVKVPQILKIFGGKSAAGITLISVILELFAITSNLSYSFVSGYPFSAWGEACFLAVQTAIVAMLVLWYNNGSALLALSFLVAYGASVYGLVSGLTPIDTLRSMQAATIPVIIGSKLIQAGTNYQNQSTGQLSAITIFMLLGGSIARIFTSIQETGDQTIIMTYLAATAVNAMITFQMIWYWNSPANKKQGKPKPALPGKKGAAKGGKSAAAAAPKAQTAGKQASNASSTAKKGGKKAKKDN